MQQEATSCQLIQRSTCMPRIRARLVIKDFIYTLKLWWNHQKILFDRSGEEGQYGHFSSFYTCDNKSEPNNTEGMKVKQESLIFFSGTKEILVL